MTKFKIGKDVKKYLNNNVDEIIKKHLDAIKEDNFIPKKLLKELKCL